ERPQRRLLLVDVGRLVQQEPEQACVVASEGDRMIHETPTLADVGHDEGQLLKQRLASRRAPPRSVRPAIRILNHRTPNDARTSPEPSLPAPRTLVARLAVLLSAVLM